MDGKKRTLVLKGAYAKGYAQALKDINTPQMVIQGEWEPSECPRCRKSYWDYEPCHDGYYQRCYSLERCPYCGQTLTWYEKER